MNTYIDNVTLQEAIDYIEKCIQERMIIQVTTLNADHIVRFETDEYLKRICSSSELNLADGHRLIKIAKRYKTPIKEKICGSDLAPVLSEIAAEKGYSIYLLGAAEGVARIAAEKLREKNPSLKIAGFYSPPLGFEKDPVEIKRINRKLLESHADILFVAFGVPKQEKFIYENKSIYQIPISINVGGTIDFIAGTQKRAPKWINKIGMEWFYRFLHNPKRLFKRYFIDDIKIYKLAKMYKPKLVKN